MSSSSQPHSSRSTDPLWNPILDLCAAAGKLIVEHYQDAALAGRLATKADDSPLTRADLASHALLEEGLAGLDPQLPLLSEESDAQAIAGRRDWERFWMVDPLDGTREFLERTGQFTINVALIEAQRAVAGLLYEPLGEVASVGIVGEGAWRCRHNGDCWQWTGIAARPCPQDDLVLLASRRHRNAGLDCTLQWFANSHRVERRNAGSALKFADLARGEADLYPRFSPCSEWDVAAGDALLTAAGGAVLGLDGEPLRYNCRDTLLNAPFLAVGDRRPELWRDLLERLRALESE